MIDPHQFESQISGDFAASIAAIQMIAPLSRLVASASAIVADCLLSGKKVLTCGNGGSAADASHLATELIVRFIGDRPAYPAIALNDSGSTLTAAANDYGFEHVFERQISALGMAGDVLVAFSTSGNSKSIVNALHMATQKKMRTIVFLGRGGGSCKGLAEIELIVPSDSTARVQECHLVMYHALCMAIDPLLKTGK